MDPREFVEIARHLALGRVEGRRGTASQSDLRRAVSTVYYAMFHALAAMCANALAEGDADEASTQAWQQTYRSLEHGYARSQCSNVDAMRRFAPQIQTFGRLFGDLQLWRQLADYDPTAHFNQDDVLAVADQAQLEIERLTSAPPPHRRAFALHMLLRQRR